jgi:hypothetical protein
MGAGGAFPLPVYMFKKALGRVGKGSARIGKVARELRRIFIQCKMLRNRLIAIAFF